MISEDIRKRATDLQSKFILTDEVRAERVKEAVKDLPFVQEVIVIGQADGCTPIDLLLNDDGKGWYLDLNMPFCVVYLYHAGLSIYK